MEHLVYKHDRQTPATGTAPHALVGVVASGNLEILVERAAASDACDFDISTAATGFAQVWEAVIADFAARGLAGGLRFSINDGGARPDMVSLRLAQALQTIARESP